MRKKKALRLAGFITAACATTALVATAAQSTGAWFTSSQDGNLQASSGHLTLSLYHPSQSNINFAGLMPGATPTTAPIDYKVDASSGKVDLWLVFDTNSKTTSKDNSANQVSRYQLFTGGGDTTGDDNGMGRYGYFSVSDSNGVWDDPGNNGKLAFQSGNLKFSDGTNTPGKDGSDGNACATDSLGRGGSSWTATDLNKGNGSEYCGVPVGIELASNLAPNASGTVTVSFGLDGYMQATPNQFNDPNVPFFLVATQHGEAPWDGHNAPYTAPPTATP